MKRHKPSVIFIPNVGVWWEILADSVKRTFVGLLRSLPPTDPILLLGILEYQSHDEKPNPDMLRELFGFSSRDQYELNRPDDSARYEYWQTVVDFIRQSPDQLPDPDQRKKRKLAVLPEAPVAVAPANAELSKAELKAQKKKDHQTLNILKLHIQPIMEQIKLKYKKFRNPPIEDAQIAHLFDDTDPKVLTTDLTEEQRQQQSLFRPYEVAKDSKGVPGLKEVMTDKFFYNLDIVTIEKRLSNGYYKRPKDFLADIKRLSKDAKTLGEEDRLLKAKEMLTNVEVDIAAVETQHAAMCAECEGVYEREQARERACLAKLKPGQGIGEKVPTIGAPHMYPANGSKTGYDDSGPIVLGEHFSTPSRVPGVNPDKDAFIGTMGNGVPRHVNGFQQSQHGQEDAEMLDAQLDVPDGQHGSQQRPVSQQSLMGTQTAMLPPASAQSLQKQRNSTSTNSGTRNSNGSSGPFSQFSTAIMRPGDYPDFGRMGPGSGSGSGSQNLPDTQPPSNESQQIASTFDPFGSQGSAGSQHNPAAPTKAPARVSSVSALLNDEDAADPPNARPQLIVNEDSIQHFLTSMVDTTSGLSLEQMEQCKARIMDKIWRERGNWNRDQVLASVAEVFNESVTDIQACQEVLSPSQRLAVQPRKTTLIESAESLGPT